MGYVAGMTLPRLSLLLALLGGGLVLAGVLVGPVGFMHVEGATFERSAGVAAYSSVFTGWGRGVGLLSPRDGNLWLGAGIALLVAAAAGMLAHAAGLRLVRTAAN